MYLSDILERIQRNVTDLTRDPSVNPALGSYVIIENVKTENQAETTTTPKALDLSDTDPYFAYRLPAYNNDNVYFFNNKNVVIGGTTGTPVGSDFYWTTKEGNPTTGDTVFVEEKFVKSIIIRGGNLIIRSNLIYKSPEDSVGIIVLKSRDHYATGGNVFIDPAVTNIQANFFAEGSIMPLATDSANYSRLSSLKDALKITNLNPGLYPVTDINRTTQLNNQLVFSGIVTSLGNTVNGSTKGLPYNNASDNRSVDIAAHRLFTLNIYGEPIAGGKRANLYGKFGKNLTNIADAQGICYQKDFNNDDDFTDTFSNEDEIGLSGLDLNRDNQITTSLFTNPVKETEYIRDLNGNGIPDQDENQVRWDNCQGSKNISPIIISPDGRIVKATPPGFNLPIEYTIERKVF